MEQLKLRRKIISAGNPTKVTKRKRFTFKDRSRNKPYVQY